MANEYKGMYKSSFGGADIQAVIGTATVGTLQAISYSITREKGPVYVMGSADPKSFARGKRAIAGSLVFLMIDKAAFINHIKDYGVNRQFYATVSDIRMDFSNSADELKAVFESILDPTNVRTGDADRNIEGFADGGQMAGRIKQLSDVWYADQVLPFDVNIIAANEVGQTAKKSFSGVEILNEGGGVSVDDLAIEEQYTYVCRGITPWTKII